MSAAQSLLQAIREFGWPIFAYAIFAPISTYVLPSLRSREENSARLLFVGVIIAAIETSFFLVTESYDALQVARLNPVWGIYVLLLLLVGVSAGGRWAVVRAREDRIALSISGNSALEPPAAKSNRQHYIVGCAVWAAASVLAVLWLARIANTR